MVVKKDYGSILISLLKYVTHPMDSSMKTLLNKNQTIQHPNYQGNLIGEKIKSNENIDNDQSLCHEIKIFDSFIEDKIRNQVYQEIFDQDFHKIQTLDHKKNPSLQFDDEKNLKDISNEKPPLDNKNGLSSLQRSLNKNQPTEKMITNSRRSVIIGEVSKPVFTKVDKTSVSVTKTKPKDKKNKGFQGGLILGNRESRVVQEKKFRESFRKN